MRTRPAHTWYKQPVKPSRGPPLQATHVDLWKSGFSVCCSSGWSPLTQSVWASQGVSPRSHDGQSQGEDNQFLDIDGADAIGGSNQSACSLGVEWRMFLRETLLCSFWRSRNDMKTLFSRNFSILNFHQCPPFLFHLMSIDSSKKVQRGCVTINIPGNYRWHPEVTDPCSVCKRLTHLLSVVLVFWSIFP